MTPTTRAKTIALGVVAGGLLGVLSASTAAAVPPPPESPRPVAVSDLLPGVLGAVPCLFTTGSALFCVGIT